MTAAHSPPHFPLPQSVGRVKLRFVGDARVRYRVGICPCTNTINQADRHDGLASLLCYLPPVGLHTFLVRNEYISVREMMRKKRFVSDFSSRLASKTRHEQKEKILAVCTDIFGV